MAEFEALTDDDPVEIGAHRLLGRIGGRQGTVYAGEDDEMAAVREVAEFCISRLLERAGADTERLVGTPAYMAPEQLIKREPPDRRPPFEHQDLAGLMYRIVHHRPDLSALPETLRPLVAECLSKDPGQRPTAYDALTRRCGPPRDPAGRSGRSEEASPHPARGVEGVATGQGRLRGQGARDVRRALVRLPGPGRWTTFRPSTSVCPARAR